MRKPDDPLSENAQTAVEKVRTTHYPTTPDLYTIMFLLRAATSKSILRFLRTPPSMKRFSAWLDIISVVLLSLRALTQRERLLEWSVNVTT